MADGDLLAGSAFELQPRPSDHVLAKVKEEHAGLRFRDGLRDQFLGFANRLRRVGAQGGERFFR